MGIVIPFPKRPRTPDFNVSDEGEQAVLDFDKRPGKPAPVVRLCTAAAEDRAYALYNRACLLDDNQAGPTQLQAELMYEEALRLDPTLAPAMVNLGNIRKRQGYQGMAFSLYERALEIDPESYEAHYNRAYVFGELGRWEEARDGFKRAVELAPSFDDGHYMLAAACELLGEPLRARVHFRRFLALAPESEFAVDARAALARLSGARRTRKRRVKT
jgi:tetratricopeptide (TPR) repeat protein